MGRGLEMAVPIGHTVRENGISVVAIIHQPEPDQYSHITPSKTALYEASHALVARKRFVGVNAVTIRPGPGYLGATWLDAFDAPSAMVHPGDGDGHDRRIVLANKQDPESAASTARIILSNNSKALKRIASSLELHGTLSGTEVDKEIEDAEKKPETRADVFVLKKNGENEHHKNVEVKDGIIVFDVTKVDEEKHNHDHEDEHLHDVFYGRQNEFELAG